MLVFLALSNNSIWLDEAYCLLEIQLSWKELIYMLQYDLSPPFYYSVLKGSSLVFGSSVAAMTMVSVFPTVLMIILVSFFLKKEFSDKAVIVFLLSCIVSQNIAFYSIEIKMYSWALFFITMMAVSAWYFFKSGKRIWWIALLLCAVGTAYTNYWAAAAAVIGYFLLFFWALKYRKDKITAMLLLAVSGIILYLPWFLVFIKQFLAVSGSDFWIPPITINTVIGYVKTFFSTGNIFIDILFCSMFGIVLILFFVKKNKTGKDFFAFGVLCWAILLVLFGISVSIAIRPMFYDRYMTPICGLVLLFFAIECGTIDKKRVMAFICVVLASIGITSFAYSAHREITENREYRTFHNYMLERVHRDDVFVFILNGGKGGGAHVPLTISYLFPEQVFTALNLTGEKFGHVHVKDGSLNGRLWGSKYVEYERMPSIDNAEKRTVWTFVVDTDNPPPHHPEVKGTFCGSFGWGWYKFHLYVQRPD
jgi:4-amino-4-deoxy-L-arabinose transferase-like glycosyltransferase